MMIKKRERERKKETKNSKKEKKERKNSKNSKNPRKKPTRESAASHYNVSIRRRRFIKNKKNYGERNYCTPMATHLRAHL